MSETFNRPRSDGDGGLTDPIYVVTDVETNGGDPLKNAMLSFASVAVDRAGLRLSTFYATLEPTVDSIADEYTMRWWRRNPKAFAAATLGARPAEQVMKDYVAWIKTLPARCVFTANPVSFDGSWIDYYLRRFTEHCLFRGPYEGPELFFGPGLDITSFATGVFGGDYRLLPAANFPPSWQSIAHDHVASNDAENYANILAKLFELRDANQSSRGVPTDLS